jgi:precorrin-6B methylase 1
VSAIGRVGTWVAVIALGVNALLLGAAGLAADRPGLLLLAAVAAIAAGGVWVAWRRHLRLLEAVRQERREMGDEARALRELVRRPK